MLAFSGKKFLVRWFSTNVYAGARAFLGKSNFLFGSGYAGLGAGGFECVARRETGWLFVQDNREKRTVDVKTAIIFDEAQFPELVHEKIDARARGADHFRKRFLRDLGKHFLGFVLLAIASEQQESASEAFLAGVEKLIDQVLFDANVARKHVGEEAVGDGFIRVEHANHLILINHERFGRRDCGSRSHANRLAGEAPFAEEIARAENREDRLLARFGNHGELHTARFNVKNSLGGIALAIDGLGSPKFNNLSRKTGGVKKSLGVEGTPFDVSAGFNAAGKLSHKIISWYASISRLHCTGK